MIFSCNNGALSLHKDQRIEDIPMIKQSFLWHFHARQVYKNLWKENVML